MNAKLLTISLAGFFLIRLTDFALAKKVPTLTLSAAPLCFSPNKDEKQDEIIFKIKGTRIKSMTSWEMQLRDSAGIPRKTFSGIKNLPESLFWDGTDDFGAPCAEGKYDAAIKLWDKENRPVAADPLQVVLDITPPAISLSPEQKVVKVEAGTVSPMTFSFSAVDLSGISSWKFQIRNQEETEIFSDSSSGSPPSSKTFSEVKLVDLSKKIAAILFVEDLCGNIGTSTPVELNVAGQPAELTTPEKSVAKPAEKLPLPVPVPIPASVPQSLPPSAEKKWDVPFLQITAILSIAELFGTNANNQTAILPQAATLLTPLGRTILNAPGARATILGHVSAGKNRQEEKALSSYFAWRVFSFLVKQMGLEKSAISVKGLGADVPIADNKTALGRARNRRIEIQIFLPAEGAK